MSIYSQNPQFFTDAFKCYQGYNKDFKPEICDVSKPMIQNATVTSNDDACEYFHCNNGDGMPKKWY